MMNGYGELTCAPGKYYIGNHTNDKKSGFGIFFNNSSMKAFLGFWSDGKRHGVGKYLEKNKPSKLGLFNKGALVKWLTNEKEILNAFKTQTEIDLNLLKLELPELVKFVFKKGGE